MVRITGVEAHGSAAAAGVKTGDLLLTINGHAIKDVLDYRFYLAERTVELSISRNGESFGVLIHKDIYEDIGLCFETPLMDQKHSCANHCIFCFIDQLPRGLRESLYFKDDDARLSFLHGNYITMTNLHESDVARIIAMRISPVRVSVHTTDPALRCRIMGNRRAGEVLSYLRRFADAGLRLCAQIVLCRGVNDGVALDRTLLDLSALYPSLDDVSIVPAGLTRYREGLTPLTPYTPAESAAVIAQVNAFGDRCLETLGERIFRCADEFYLKAGMPIPPDSYYGEYGQLENGVGMIRSLQDEFESELSAWTEEDVPADFSREVSIATGHAAAPLMRDLTAKLCRRVPGLTVHVFDIENRFFGPEITVAGLLTGKDLAEQLQGRQLGEELLISADMLRAEDELFLCGMSRTELSARLSVPVRACRATGEDLLCALLGRGESK